MRPPHTSSERTFRRELKLRRSRVVAVFALSFLALIIGCDPRNSLTGPIDTSTPTLEAMDVENLITQAVELAQRMGDTIVVAVTDRAGNTLGVFRMNGATITAKDPVFGPIVKARTAAFLSSNQHGFTSLTACYITRNHFPPGVANTGGGPLFGVPFSSLVGGDVQPNPGFQDGDTVYTIDFALTGSPGLTGVPGGVPVFKDGLLAGGIGVSGGDLSPFQLDLCGGVIDDEIIALGAAINYTVPSNKRGDNIFLDGIRLLYANAETPEGNFTLSYSNIDPALGTIESGFSITKSPEFMYPKDGGVVKLGGKYDFDIRAGSAAGGLSLSAAEVAQIIDQAVAQANITRAAIRRPLGTAMRAFITVCDVNGDILGIWRTPDATIFSFDVSAQKARTVVAFSDPSTILGIRIRSILGLSTNAEIGVTCRAVGFLSQDFYPPGIDEETLGEPVESGPLFEGPLFKLQDNLDLTPYGNGITIFPGGIPLYKTDSLTNIRALVGGIGVSGDGVDQDDLVAYAGSIGFEPPDIIKCDQFFYRGVRLPYVKFPRRPEI
ncbi:MAG: heme-binding protein [candidate division Zixibacteria bacterium]|nr:heme-binding protein [candidate division Zixibacteria bacterium]